MIFFLKGFMIERENCEISILFINLEIINLNDNFVNLQNYTSLFIFQIAIEMKFHFSTIYICLYIDVEIVYICL